MPKATRTPAKRGNDVSGRRSLPGTAPPGGGIRFPERTSDLALRARLRRTSRVTWPSSAPKSAE
jgi:hypothetical protein